MKHVEVVIKLFDPDFNVRRISVRRRYKGNPWFKRGTLFRHAVDALRKAKGPMTARQIAEEILAAKGVSGVAPKAIRDLAASVLASLQNNDGKAVRRVGEDVPSRWQVIG
jgi:hypothetical protein